MVKLVGRELVDYISKKSGKRVYGYSLSFVKLDDSPNCEGTIVEVHYVNMELFNAFFDVPLDTKMILHYDYYRNVNGCSCLND